MFAIANSAALQAAQMAKTLPPPRPPPPKKKKERRQSTSSNGSNGSRSRKHKDKPQWPKQPSTFEVYGVKPILKSVGSVGGSERTGSTASSSSTDYDEEISVLAEYRKPKIRKDAGVSFSSVEIREYIVQLGDSPYAEGPPICLSNERQDECIIDAIQFDDMRIPDRRSGHTFRLSASERSRL